MQNPRKEKAFHLQKDGEAFQLKARVWEKKIHKAGKTCRSLIVGTPESHLEAL